MIGQTGGNPLLCSCRDVLLMESGCVVHGPWVPSVSERLVGVDWVDIPAVVCVPRLGYRRYRDMGGYAVGPMVRIPVQRSV